MRRKHDAVAFLTPFSYVCSMWAGGAPGATARDGLRAAGRARGGHRPAGSSPSLSGASSIGGERAACTLY